MVSLVSNEENDLQDFDYWKQELIHNLGFETLKSQNIEIEPSPDIEQQLFLDDEVLDEKEDDKGFEMSLDKSTN